MAQVKNPMKNVETYESHQHKIVNRLKRARGQLDGVIRAMEAGEDCREILTQLAAVEKALDKAGFVLVSSIMRDCVAAESGKELGRYVPDQAELEKLFLMLA